MSRGNQMQEQFWIDKWTKEEIGFHQNSPHHFLKSFGKDFFHSKQTVFVPLCGASVDMIYLRDLGLKVVGVELSEKAVLRFFEENQLSYETSEVSSFKTYRSEKIEIYVGDMFKLGELSKNIWSEIDCIYDRASIVALPQDLRLTYTEMIKKSLSNAACFLISFSFDNEEVGPPFSVDYNKLVSYYQGTFNLKLVKETEAKNPPMHGGILSYLKESLYYMTPVEE